MITHNRYPAWLRPADPKGSETADVAAAETDDFEEPIIPRYRGENGACILGLHLEGPFINPQKKGAHNPRYLKGFQKGYKMYVTTPSKLSEQHT